MLCPQCDQPAIAGDRFCDNCGTSFEAQPAVAVVLAEPADPMHCPCCGVVNPVGARYCDQCGADLNLVAAPEPVVSSEGVRTCRSCGSTDNSPSDKFCGYCGTQLPVEQEVAVPELLNAPEKMRLMLMAWE